MFYKAMTVYTTDGDFRTQTIPFDESYKGYTLPLNVIYDFLNSKFDGVMYPQWVFVEYTLHLFPLYEGTTHVAYTIVNNENRDVYTLVRDFVEKKLVIEKVN